MTRALDDLLEDLRRQRLTMAVVADEYGRTVGVRYLAVLTLVAGGRNQRALASR